MYFLETFNVWQFQALFQNFVNSLIYRSKLISCSTAQHRIEILYARVDNDELYYVYNNIFLHVLSLPLLDKLWDRTKCLADQHECSSPLLSNRIRKKQKTEIERHQGRFIRSIN